MSNPDLTYTIDGIFARFMPETSAGEMAWKQIVAVQGEASVFAWHFEPTLQQLRAAGYTVEPAKPSTCTMTDDGILAALNA
jgi:hypothetical protein